MLKVLFSLILTNIMYSMNLKLRIDHMKVVILPASSSDSSNLPFEENRNYFKRISNKSEALNQSHNSTPSSSSSNLSLDENRNCFKRVFDLRKKTNDYAFEIVRREI